VLAPDSDVVGRIVIDMSSIALSSRLRAYRTSSPIRRDGPVAAHEEFVLDIAECWIDAGVSRISSSRSPIMFQ